VRTAELSAGPVVADCRSRGVMEGLWPQTPAWSINQCPPVRVPVTSSVLVVDPCEDTVLSTSWLLALWGYEVRSAATGPAALEAARAYRPAAILMELRLPGLDGWAVARQLSQMGDRPARGLIAVTGCGSARDRARSRSAGFDCHLVKPVCPDVLRERLESFTGRQEVAK
jgi:two-component system, chemotaxis family, CheB/CheR fusion protein